MVTINYMPGDRLPARGNRFSRAIGRLILRLMGFRIEGMLVNRPKLMIVGAPHTSNWDFILVMGTMLTMGLKIGWMAKHSMFKWPFAGLLRWLGGIPVNREAAGGVVAETVRAYRDAEKLVIAVSPEGTRATTGAWKTGFYRIASEAGVPIVLAYLNYDKKVVGFGPVFTPTGDLKKDIAAIQEFYIDKGPRHVDRFDRKEG